ncbi:MAE_28990/MAE_18760 family HEPN-like nuclease [Phormidium pseudopriestleyi]|uniref:MAE_28990/MAE_18760 family HEPN-like nuclease n=1 Tax=Phormidium pseudopriestleyi TaxID=1759527 RepID=UPI001A9018A8|nr:MAE_28990/MAE_18760 family HEPN-like nuclease [Phormidium pseudopriestleyi]
MKMFIREFQRRVAEIDKYFELVDKMDEIDKLGSGSGRSIIFPTTGPYTVDIELQKILKSHCYLLLYNLIESSIRNGIMAIHDAIAIEQLTYQELHPKIQKLWLLNDLSKSFRDATIKKETIADNLQEALQVVVDNTVVTLDPNNIPISGNLDVQTIKSLMEMYGVFGPLPFSEKIIHPVLNFVVKIRCDLAHGNVSFSEASNQILWSKLLEEKEKIVRYLEQVLQNIENYIDNHRYKT